VRDAGDKEKNKVNTRRQAIQEGKPLLYLLSQDQIGRLELKHWVLNGAGGKHKS